MTAPHILATAEVDHGPGHVTVALRGEIDLSTVAVAKSALMAALADADERILVVDLRELTFMDSSGLHALCALRDQAIRRDHRLVLIRGPRHIHRVFELTATDALFEFAEDPASIA